MSTGQQLGLIGNSIKVQSLPTASAETFGAGNRFYTLIGQQEGYITGHTYHTIVANDVYSWEDVAGGNYNMLDNIPVINQDLTSSGFTPAANTYYRHTGATTASYINGVIYLWNGTGYAALDGSGGGTTLNKYTVTLEGGSHGLGYQEVKYVYRIRANCKGDFKIYPDIGNTETAYSIPIHITSNSSNAYIVLEYATVDSSKNILRDYYIFGTGGKGYRRYRTSFYNDTPAGTTTYYEDTFNQKLTIVYYNDTEISRY